METRNILRRYYKFALPISVAILLWEELLTPNATLNKYLKQYILGPGESAEVFL
jgi:hypothetical protein